MKGIDRLHVSELLGKFEVYFKMLEGFEDDGVTLPETLRSPPPLMVHYVRRFKEMREDLVDGIVSFIEDMEKEE